MQRFLNTPLLRGLEFRLKSEWAPPTPQFPWQYDYGHRQSPTPLPTYSRWRSELSAQQQQQRREPPPHRHHYHHHYYNSNNSKKRRRY